MRFNPTQSGGRILQGQTPYGDFVVEWSADGQLIRESLTLRTPVPKSIDVSNVDTLSSQAEETGCSPCEEAARKRWALEAQVRSEQG